MRFKRRSHLPLYNYTGEMRSLVIREITILPACLQVGSYEGFLWVGFLRKQINYKTHRNVVDVYVWLMGEIFFDRRM